MAFDRMSPIGAERNDRLASHLLHTIRNCLIGGPNKPLEDFQIFWDDVELRDFLRRKMSERERLAQGANDMIATMKGVTQQG